ncbi:MULTISPECIES: hypothetical protein [unclassified Streptomyces]|uniref:hypothetical protein n=1 Tax=unclassified Streptomyces TaxID=2593676 RepID=UPI0004C2325B|nr:MULTISPECIES: hypothetical protein [unclassified Streptomyces]
MTNERDPDDAARSAEAADEERAAARPFSYPYPERRANVRATRHISREEADADSVPGVPGGYGSTGGGQPGGSSGTSPDPEEGLDPSDAADTVAGGEPEPGGSGDRER